nr:integrase, catalytic region, zinc finger, CCHC-type, peptidase aspartic, catalytic [Tanacetum cinerariifolium]
ENGVTRPKKYSELSATEAIQADCDVKVTNIILQGLPPEVYSLVRNHKVTKEPWERIQLLMQETSLTKQERECKLYDEFDKFDYKKEKSLRDLYLRISMLLNDINIYNMKLEQFQVNTKFLNTLPPEWSKFVTDVKLHGIMIIESIENGPLLWPTIKENGVTRPKKYSELSATEAIQADCDVKVTNIILQGLPPEVYSLVRNHKVTKELWERIQLLMQGTSLTKQERECDDPIDPINPMMLFLTAVVTSRYPPTNNQLRNSSNPRQQVTINNGRVTVQPIQGRQNSLTAGTSRPYTSGPSGNNSGKQRTVVYYNCKGEGHMELALEKQVKELNNIVFKRNQSAQNTELSAEQVFWSQNSENSEEPNLSTRPTLVEIPKELPKVSMVNSSLKKLKFHLASFDVVVKERTTATAITNVTWGFEHTFRDDIIPFVKVLKDLFNSFDQFLIGELSEVQNVFNQMKQAVEKHRVETNRFQDKIKEVLNENERLLEQAISRDTVNIVYLDSGCSKHMTGDCSQLTNFVNKFLGTVKFDNDHVAKIMGYGDYKIENVTISRVYFMEGLGHNLFSMGQFCDSDLEVAFRQHICFIHNLEGVDLLTGSQGNNLYTLSLGDMMA